ncbi:MAG: DUF177 domain-containing protein [Prevotella sp.]|nr:DUF177 domain-containing protein [Prevotella sp.]
MCTLENFKVDLKGLKDSETVIHYHLDDAYFEAIDAPDVREGELDVELIIRKASAYFELDFHTEGIVHVLCDLCLDDMEQPIESDEHVVAQFGDTFDEEGEILIVDENEGILDTSWLIYEFICLAIPIKHVHAPGKCNAAMSKLLNEHSAVRSSEAEVEDTIDPRWEALRKLKK